MRHGSLFSGIGGFDLAAEWMGWENVFHCEWMEFPRKVLDFYWPDADSHIDICKTDFTKYANKIDILTGGFPCQPYSGAGKRLGTEDERHLWPEMLRTIQEIKPRWVVGENVLGLVDWNNGLVFQEVCLDLETEGYEVQPFILPASGKGAPHQRYRVWFVAYLHKVSRQQLGISETKNSQQWNKKIGSKNRQFVQLVFDGNTFAEQWERGQRITSEPPMVSESYGFPNKLDGITFSKWAEQSNESYGNAIVPQVAHTIFQTIEQYERPI